MAPAKFSRELQIWAIRAILSPQEYERLYIQLLQCRAQSAPSRYPTPKELMQLVDERGDLTTSAVRCGERSFATVYLSLCTADVLISAFKGRRRKIQHRRNALSGLAAGSGVFLSRSVFSMIKWLQIRLRKLSRGNTKQDLVHPLLPAIIAGLVSGLALSIHPADARRTTIAIYTFTRALEFGYNYLDDEGYIPDLPWWYGSWLIFPLTSAQLLHAFQFDRDTFPSGYARLIMRFSREYVPQAPPFYKGSAPWPSQEQIVEHLGKIAQLNYPFFYSPIIYPNSSAVSATFNPIWPILFSAHPAIKRMSCALLHPQEPSCLRNYITFSINQMVKTLQFMLGVYTLSAAAQFKNARQNPLGAILRILSSSFRSSVFVTMAIGTSWASICGLQRVLPSAFLPTKRYFISGFLGGLWAYVDQKNGRGRYLYSLRLSMDSTWKILVKHGYLRPVKNGDVYLFALSLASVFVIFDTSNAAVSGSLTRKCLCLITNRGWTDPLKGEHHIEEQENSRQKQS